MTMREYECEWEEMNVNREMSIHKKFFFLERGDFVELLKCQFRRIFLQFILFNVEECAIIVFEPHIHGDGNEWEMSMFRVCTANGNFVLEMN